MQNEPQWRRALRSLCLKKLKDFGGKCTSRQIADDLRKDVDLIAPRMTELAEMGVIRDSGERVGAGRGRPQVVWEVVELGGAVTDQDDDEDAAPSWFQRYGK
jgi:predicted ArsR family transcriptional regulator